MNFAGRAAAVGAAEHTLASAAARTAKVADLMLELEVR